MVCEWRASPSAAASAAAEPCKSSSQLRLVLDRFDFSRLGARLVRYPAAQNFCLTFARLSRSETTSGDLPWPVGSEDDLT
jgi:hypothetical protein